MTCIIKVKNKIVSKRTLKNSLYSARRAQNDSPVGGELNSRASKYSGFLNGDLLGGFSVYADRIY